MENRRHFLKVLGAGAALAISCGSDTGQSEASGTFSAGNVSALSVGTIRAIGGQPLVIARDANGVYAMSTICTHDSHFTNGNRTSGPASGQLKHYLVTIDAAGEITITAGSVVAGDTRVAVT